MEVYIGYHYPSEQWNETQYNTVHNESAEKGESAGTVVSKILAMEITKL